MMNRQLKPLLLAASAVLLATACNDDTLDLSRPIELHLAPAAPVTAVTRADVDATNFDADDQVGIYFAWTTGATAETGTAINASLVENAQWTTATTGTDTPLYWQNTVDAHTVYAYYPYTADVTGDYKVAFDRPTTQTSDNEAYNILWGKHSCTAQTSVKFELGHCMSLVTITLEPGEGYEEDGSDMPDINKVELLGDNYYASGTLNLATGAVTPNATSTAAPTITTYASDAGHRAILMPGEAIGKIRITVEGATYTYTPGQQEAVESVKANTQYTFALQLNKAQVTLGSLTIDNWDKTDLIEGNADMDIPSTQTPSN